MEFVNSSLEFESLSNLHILEGLDKSQLTLLAAKVLDFLYTAYSLLSHACTNKNDS